MTPEEQQADMLARWLAERGGPPPEGVDPDVLEAIYALRPELAPPPRVTADDILSGLAWGSDAAVDAPHGVVFDAGDARADEPPSAEARDLAPIPAPANRTRAPFWLGSGLVGLLAAAVVTLVLIPTLTTINPELPAAGLAPEPMTAPPPPPPPPPAPAAEAPSGDFARADAESRPAPAPVYRERAVEVPLPDPKADGETAVLRTTTEEVTTSTTPGSGWGPPADDAPSDADKAVEVEAEVVRGSSGAQPASTRVTTASGGSAGRTPPQATTTNRQESRKAGSGSANASPRESQDFNDSLDGMAESSAKTEDVYGNRNQTNAAPPETVSAVARPAKEAYDRREFTKARDLCQEALGRSGLSNVQKADLQWVLGLSLQALGNAAEARRAFDEAARLRGGK